MPVAAETLKTRLQQKGDGLRSSSRQAVNYFLQTDAGQKLSRDVSQRVDKLKAGSKGKFEEFLRSDVGHVAVHELVDRIYEYAPQRLFEWQGLENIAQIGDPERIETKKVLIVNHRSHGDAPAVIATINKIRNAHPETFQRTVYTVAGSMETGEQGLLMQTLWVYGGKPFFLKNRIQPDNVVSENDVNERHMIAPPNNGEGTKKAMKDVRALSVIHAAGSTKEGKTNREKEKPEPYGLQPLDRGLQSVLTVQYKNKIPTQIIPVVVSGGDIFFDPNKRGFSVEGMKALARMLTSGEGTKVGIVEDFIRGVFFGNLREKPGLVTVGEGVDLAELFSDRRNFGDNVIRLLAKHTEPQYLGDYGRKLLVS